MMVFPNFYQMAVQFSVTPPIAEVDEPEDLNLTGQFISPLQQQRKQNVPLKQK
jgi:hypothetical protein